MVMPESAGLRAAVGGFDCCSIENRDPVILHPGNVAGATVNRSDLPSLNDSLSLRRSSTSWRGGHMKMPLMVPSTTGASGGFARPDRFAVQFRRNEAQLKPIESRTAKTRWLRPIAARFSVRQHPVFPCRYPALAAADCAIAVTPVSSSTESAEHNNKKYVFAKDASFYELVLVDCILSDTKISCNHKYIYGDSNHYVIVCKSHLAGTQPQNV